MKECTSCRSRKVQKRECLLTKIGFDTAENKPDVEVWSNGLLAILIYSYIEPRRSICAKRFFWPIMFASSQQSPKTSHVKPNTKTYSIPNKMFLLPTCESIYALIDCWVAAFVALLEFRVSSSSTAVPETPVLKTGLFIVGLVNVLFVKVWVPVNVAVSLAVSYTHLTLPTTSRV